ncbi:MAG TPA: hypothetical protein VK901_09210, partial [Nitrospiraceae bacterium]|nr:hypothetical protein [Nitrospiraceae bacterium]
MRKSTPQQAGTCQAQSEFAPWPQRSVLPEVDQGSGSGTIAGTAPECCSDLSEPLLLSRSFTELPVFSKLQTALQAKLTVGQPSDAYEQEAGRVAEQLMCMPEPRLPDDDTLRTQGVTSCNMTFASV